MLLCLAAWLALRWSVGASLPGTRGRAPAAAVLLDAFPAFAAFLLTLLGLARPVLAGLAVVAPAIGLIVTDRVKRVVLQEPVMFADRAELLEVIRHPRLYIPFVGVVPMVAGTLAILAAIGALIWLEPPLWHVPGWAQGLSIVAAIGAARALFVVPTVPAVLAALARRYDRWQPARDPAADAARFGMLAAFVVEATLARAERAGRQAAVASPGLAAWPAEVGPIVVVQAESFVFADRLDPALAGAAPHFEALAREARQQGRFVVPCWGANTIRTEFEALTGIDTQRLGLDRFNPYEAFARTALPSLAAQARAAGRRTICLHPYARHFYGRDTVMPALGFDEFIGIEGFADAPRNGPYVTDVALADRIAALVHQHGPRLFVFAMTIENHGPWDATHEEPAPLSPHIAALLQAESFGRWLRRLRATDAMLPPLVEALRGTNGWLAFYGDHQPSFPGLFDRLGIADRDADYLIWSAASGGTGRSVPLAAYDLAPTLLGLMGGAQPA